MIGKKEIPPFILPGMMLYGGYMTDALRVRSYIPNRDSHLHAEVRVYQTHAKSQSRPETPEVLIAACSVPLYEKPRWSDGGQYWYLSAEDEGAVRDSSQKLESLFDNKNL